VFSRYTTAPNNAPTLAVMPMASTPHRVTRQAPTKTFAPPALAATAPRLARNSRDMPQIHGATDLCSGAMSVTASGNAAPTTKTRRRGQRRLQRFGGEGFADAQLVPGVSPQGVVRHQLVGDLMSQFG